MKPVMFCRALLVVFALGLTHAAFDGADAYTLTTLHAFCAKANCTDGKSPEGGLVMDAAGNIYGTTFYGGKSNCGTIFELSPGAQGQPWRHKVLHSLCAGFTVKNGALPISRLVLDTSGKLYGTTLNGGAHNAGVAFRLSPNANSSKWTYDKLTDLCIHDQCGENVGTLSFGLTYQGASAGALYDGASPLYGQNQQAGRFMLGTVFELSPAQDKMHWHAKNIHTFCNRHGTCPDGAFPDATLTMDGTGNLLGAAWVGGSASVGTIFELSPKSEAGKWKASALYTFCQQGDCTDGNGPNSEIVKDAAGSLYGTAASAGEFCPNSSCGVLFKLAPSGKQPQYSVLHRFCTEEGCPDGAAPSGSLLTDSSGAIYGATSHNPGTIYKMGASFETLYEFCAQNNCTDGEHPEGLMMDGAGHIFGVTAGGGAYGQGTVFELSP